VDAEGTAVDDRGAADGDVVDEGADGDVVGEGADSDVVNEGADGDVVDEGVETAALPHPAASKATSASLASFGYLTVGEPNTP